jgi:hypothetical protein
VSPTFSQFSFEVRVAATDYIDQAQENTSDLSNGSAGSNDSSFLMM